MTTKTTTGVALLATGLASSLALAADKHEHHDHGVVFTAKGKETKEIRINGRLHFQYDNLYSEDEAGAETRTNHFYYRRLRLGAKAKLNQDWSAETVYEFGSDSGNGGSVDKAIIVKKTKVFGQKAKLRFGMDKVPFGLEEIQSSTSIPTIERSVATRFFSDDTDFGVRHSGVNLTTIDKKAIGFVYSLHVGNAAQGEGSRLGGSAEASNSLGYWGSAQYKFDAKTTLVGVDYGHVSDLASSANAGGMDAYTIYGKTMVGGIKLQAEYFNAEIEEVGYDSDSNAYSITASTMLGKWEPVIRYSYLETDSAAFGIDSDELVRRSASTGSSIGAAQGQDSEISSFYFGVNYHANKAVKYMFGYEIAEAENFDGTNTNDISGLRARIQLLF